MFNYVVRIKIFNKQIVFSTDTKKEKEEDEKKKERESKRDDRKSDSSDDDDEDSRRSTRDKKKKDRVKLVTKDKHLLLSFVYFDQTHCGYIFDKDMEELLYTLGENRIIRWNFILQIQLGIFRFKSIKISSQEDGKQGCCQRHSALPQVNR